MPTSSSSSAQAARQALAGRLREIRLDAGLNARELAAAAGWHEAKTSRIENAKQAPSESDLRRWCHVCGVEAMVPELIEQLRAVDSMWLDWRRAERAGLKQLNVAVRDIYERTRLYRSYSQDVMPGLLQTAEYTRSVLEAVRARRVVAVDDIEAAVSERMARQHILYEGDHRFSFVLEAAALTYRIGGPQVLAGQLRHLVAVMSLPSIGLGIIPPEADRTVWCPVESFYVFDDVQANAELVSGFLTITQRREVAMYTETFTRLAELAVTGQAARELIRAALADLETGLE